MRPDTKSLILTVALATVLTMAVAMPAAAAVPNPTPTELSMPEGYTFCDIWDINNSGDIVGFCGSETDEQPCIWQPNAGGWALTVLPVLEGYVGGEARAINASGKVVGLCSKLEDMGEYYVSLSLIHI